MSAILEFCGISLELDSAAQFRSSMSEDLLHSGVTILRHNGPAVRQRREDWKSNTRRHFHTSTRGDIRVHVVPPFFFSPNYTSLSLSSSAASPLRFSCRTGRRIEHTAHARSTHPLFSSDTRNHNTYIYINILKQGGVRRQEGF